MKQVSLFSDGSSLGNPGFGGYCAILKFKNSEKIIKGARENVTNNQMELLAVIEGLKALKEPCKVEIISDSTYVVNGINEWLKNWQKRDFAKVKNPNMWREYVNVAKKHKIFATWVRGHNGHEENEICDELARQEAQNLRDN